MNTDNSTQSIVLPSIVIPKIYSPKPRRISTSNPAVEKEFHIHQPISKSLSNDFNKQKEIDCTDINKFSVDEIDHDFLKMKRMSLESDVDTEEEIMSILGLSGIYCIDDDSNQVEQIERVHNPFYKNLLDYN